jgi:energy-coupling factor transporter ATP-binding protein EcfA2
MALRSFRIQGFKTFGDLSLPHLAQLNLVVGKNSSGKTTVLEALRLYLTEDYVQVIGQILVSRDELDLRGRRRSESSLPLDPLLIEALFHGRPRLDQRPELSLGEISGGATLAVQLSWLRRVLDETDSSIRYLAAGDEDDPDLDADLVPGLEFRNGGRSLVPLDRLDRWRRRIQRPNPQSSTVFLSSGGMSPAELGAAWDAVALTEDEDTVIHALRMIVPALEKLVMVQSPMRNTERIMMAKLANFREPVPFKSLGEGAFHLLSISLSLIRARGGALLVDEVENGIHYSVQPDMWRMIWRQANAWDVQVFATTHSWDCVQGFQQAVGEVDSALFRLEAVGEQVRAVSFHGDELAIAAAEGIEVR